MKHRLLLCSPLLLGLFAGQGVAQENLRLEQAIIQVLENHPKLMVSDYRAQAMAARMRQALQSPADHISLDLENFAGSGDVVGFGDMEATLSLSRTLELGNKAAIRGDVVKNEMQILESDMDYDRLNILADTAQRFLHVVADQEYLNLAEEAIELVRLTESLVENRIQAGRTPETERHRIIINLASEEQELNHKIHDLRSSRLRLSSLWNDKTPDFERVDADIYELQELPDFEELEILLDRNPSLVRFVREEDLYAAKLRLMRSKRKPDLDISAGLRYLGDKNDVAFIVTATVPIGSSSRARPYIEEAETLANISPLNLQQKKMELYVTLYELYQEIGHSYETFEILNERIIPAARQMLSDYENGYQAGRYSLLELVQVQQVLRNSRKLLVDTAVSIHEHRIEIDRLTGAQLTQW